MRLAVLTSLAITTSTLGTAILPVPPQIRDTNKIPLAKRQQVTYPNGVANIAALRQQPLIIMSKMTRGFRLYERNTGRASTGDFRVRSSLSKRENVGSTSLVDEANALWYGEITVGTPPQTFKIDFDTGSSDLFLPGATCGSSCRGHRKYHPTASSTSHNLNTTFSLMYGDGSEARGYQVTDTVTVSNLTATNQTFGYAENYSAGFASDKFAPDGLMGMAFPQISEYNSNPVFQTLVAQNQTAAPQFSFKLAANGSELYLGGANTYLYKGNITETPVVKEGFWQVTLDVVAVNNKTVVQQLSSIVDTGTTLIFGDRKGVADFYAAIPGAKSANGTVGDGFYTVPCSSIPDLGFTFSGRNFAISNETFNQGKLSASSEDCVAGLVGSDLNFWIVGDVFLRNVYTIFDIAKKTVGFADLA